MKKSSKKYKFGAFRIFLKRENFIFATFLRFDFSVTMPFSNFLETEIWTEKSNRKKVAKIKFSRFKKIRNAPNLYFFGWFYFSVLIYKITSFTLHEKKSDIWTDKCTKNDQIFKKSLNNNVNLIIFCFLRNKYLVY